MQSALESDFDTFVQFLQRVTELQKKNFIAFLDSPRFMYMCGKNSKL